MTLCRSILNAHTSGESNIDGCDHCKGMTYVQIEEKLNQLQELDDRYEPEDHIKQKWET